MAYSVQSAFDQFFDAINLADDHRATANARKNRIVSLLSNHFEILEAFGSGSIPRYTALKNKADLDVMVALHYGKHIKDKRPIDVLQAVRDALGEYRTQVRKNGQAVTLYYDTWPNVDIVPVSRSVDSAGNVTHFNVPDANTGGWIDSNPKKHSANIEARSGKCGQNFRKVIKMMKAWNANHSSYLQSYHIEVMALQTFDSELADLPWDVFQFFSKCHNLIATPLWHDSGYVDNYLSLVDRGEAKKRLANATDMARLAWYSGVLGHTQESITRWKQIFGGDFPLYG